MVGGGAHSRPREGSAHVRPLRQDDGDEWLRMRSLLWPECPPERHAREQASILADSAAQAVFVLDNNGSRLLGFVELSIHPHAIGCDTNPVAYVEGWWVDELHRRKKHGRALLAAGEEWARVRGCREIASDCHAHNAASRASHLASGFQETGVLIHFAKRID